MRRPMWPIIKAINFTDRPKRLLRIAINYQLAVFSTTIVALNHYPRY